MRHEQRPPASAPAARVPPCAASTLSWTVDYLLQLGAAVTAASDTGSIICHRPAPSPPARLPFRDKTSH